MKRIFKILVFFSGILIVLCFCASALKFKYDDGIYAVKIFYEQKRNSVDLLTLGSSHAYVDINTGVLFEEYGIASYNLCGSMQPIWNSYFYFKEALKTQSPKLVVLEAYRLIQDNEYDEGAIPIKNTYGLNWSKNKIEAINTSVDTDDRRDYLLEWIQWHNRYEELELSDFYLYKGNEQYYKSWKGYRQMLDSNSFVRNNPEDSAAISLIPKVEEYYRKIIELAQMNNIPLLVVVSPYSGYSANEMGKYKTAKKIAEEYSVPFIDYNTLYDELNLDFEKDFADVGHLSWSGSRKYTLALGDYIDENFHMPDRRQDERYESWRKNADNINRQVQNKLLSMETLTADYFQKLPDFKDRYIVIINLSGSDYLDTGWQPILEGMGIDSASYNTGGTWLIKNEQIFYHSPDKDYNFHIEIGNNDLELKYDIKSGQDSIIINHMQYIRTYNGMTIIVWDTVLNSIVDHIAVDSKNENSIIR